MFRCIPAYTPLGTASLVQISRVSALYNADNLNGLSTLYWASTTRVWSTGFIKLNKTARWTIAIHCDIGKS